MKRCIVMSPNFHFRLDGTAYFKETADPIELRKYLLYWDGIEVPFTYKVFFGCDDFDFLFKEGILTRTPMPNPENTLICLMNAVETTLSKEAGLEILNAHEYIFRQKNKQEPGVWSKAQMSKTLLSKGAISRESIEIELFNVIPVPNELTPLNDILEFKHRRKDELTLFRCHLNDLYQKILSQPLKELAIETEVIRLERSINDINKTVRESKISVLPRSMKSVVSGMHEIVGVATGVAGLAATQYPINSSLLAGSVAAGISVAMKMISHSDDTLPNEFTYLKSVYDELW
ncbi:DUF6236 family protein [Aeromonas salmonicida]|uniref:DUF6236 family protein n=1 Tax=Aeromonas salmonicida TaxID=645 RepID=UPI00232AD20A|nr:DUF6236 family protein [Aeromonas salmonicida]WCH27903.1 DUF6236 family protein [Aeromonas salmonicida]